MVTLGAIQKEDEALLQAIILMTCPKKLVEFGYLHGDSARAFLSVMKPDASLVSYDIDPIGRASSDPRFLLKTMSQTDYEETDVDFVFFDASHDLQLNRETFKKVEPTLLQEAIIAVHDTGLWNEVVMDTGGWSVGNGYAHRPGERLFVNWIKETYPEYQVLHLHTEAELRHGITILQKYNKLSV